MPADAKGLSDKAIAVFAFAAYHQLESGQRVNSVVQRDHAGHRADQEAVAELEARGLARADGEDIHFTEQGMGLLDTAIAGLRSALNGDSASV